MTQSEDKSNTSELTALTGDKNELIDEAKALIEKLATCAPQEEAELLERYYASVAKRAPKGKLKPVK